MELLALQFGDGLVIPVLLITLTLFALYGFFHGVVGQFLNLIALLCGSFVSFWIFRNPDLLGTFKLAGTTQGRTLLIASLVTGTLVFFMIRTIFGVFMTVGLGKLFALLFGRQGGAGVGGALLALVPGFFLVSIFGQFLSVAANSIRAEDTGAATNTSFRNSNLVSNVWDFLGTNLGHSVLASWFRTSLPASSAEVINLTRLLIMSQEHHAWDELAANPVTRPVLDNATFRELWAGPVVSLSMKDGNFTRLIQYEPLQKASRQTDLRPFLGHPDVEKILRATLLKLAPDTGEKSRR